MYNSCGMWNFGILPLYYQFCSKTLHEKCPILVIHLCCDKFIRFIHPGIWTFIIQVLPQVPRRRRVSGHPSGLCGERHARGGHIEHADCGVPQSAGWGAHTRGHWGTGQPHCQAQPHWPWRSLWRKFNCHYKTNVQCTPSWVTLAAVQRQVYPAVPQVWDMLGYHKNMTIIAEWRRAPSYCSPSLCQEECLQRSGHQSHGHWWQLEAPAYLWCDHWWFQGLYQPVQYETFTLTVNLNVGMQSCRTFQQLLFSK